MPLDLFENLDHRIDDATRRTLATANGDYGTEFLTTHACGEEALSLC